MNNPEKLERCSSPAMDEILGVPFKVLDKGFIRVIDYMGDEAAVAQMARVSYGKGTKSINEDRGLLRYLMRHRHTSPYEGNEIKLHIKMPIFVMRQWIRHRTANVNEYSARYSEMPDEFYFPELEKIKLQDTKNKQGSDGEVDETKRQSFLAALQQGCAWMFDKYSEALGGNIAREMARIGLPLNIYTECYWKIDLHNLLHFLSLRCDPHAQYEIRVYADVILNEIVKAWVPNIHQAFHDYVINGATFSAQELEALGYLLSRAGDEEVKNMKLRLQAGGVSAREAGEFMKKLGYDNE